MSNKCNNNNLKPIRACRTTTLRGEINPETGEIKGSNLKLSLHKCSKESKIKSSTFDILVG